MSASIKDAVLALELLQVAFLLLHDWIPLGRFSDTRALRRLEPVHKIVLATAISALPFVLGLIFSMAHLRGAQWPHWVENYLLISYAFLFVGELEA